MKAQTYDFCKPERIVSGDRLASDMEQSLERWLRDACALAPKKWARHVPFGVQQSFQKVENLPAADALARLHETTLGFRTPLQADGGHDSLLALPRTLLLALVAGVLGDSPAELPADRELTPVEESLAEYLVQDPLVATLQETWRGAETLAFAAPHPEPNPKWTRIFRPADAVVMSTFTLQGPFGQQEWHWLALQNDLLKLFGLAVGSTEEAPERTSSAAQLELLVREFPVEISVVLGSVDLPLSQLANLRAGDLVILNHRVTDPLVATVADTKKFLGWPGRVGSRQAFQIDTAFDE